MSLAKRAFERLIEKYGLWLIYVRADERFKCPDCYSDATREGKSLCTTCLGTGRIISKERVKARITKPGQDSTPQVQRREGLISSYDAMIYFRQDAYPKRGDLVIEVEWNVESARAGSIGQPVGVIHVYHVDEVEAMRTDEISFFQAGVSVADMSREFVEDTLLADGI